jgi:UDP-glucose 4-epimerase
MTILVTGGTGFVGSHIALALAAGHPVIAADRQPWDGATPVAARAERAGVTFAPLDICDGEALRELIQRHDVRQIVHAAAITAPDSPARAAETVAVNLGGAINVLNAALELPQVERVLLVSSSGVYANLSSDAPLAEDAPTTTESLYAITKLGAEALAARYGALSGKPMASVRLPAVYGPFERPRPSRQHTSTMRRLMDALVEGRSLRLFGPDVARDWTYAPEIGAAVGALLAAPEWHWPIYNISNGLRISLRDAVVAFARHGLRATWVADPAEADIALHPENGRAPLATQRLVQATGFRPRLGIDAGLAAWLKLESLA